MKNTKKVLSLVLSLAIAGAVAMPAFAAKADNEGSGAITFKAAATEIEPPTEGPGGEPVLPPETPDEFKPFASWNVLDFGAREIVGTPETYKALDNPSKTNDEVIALYVTNTAAKKFNLTLKADKFVDEFGVEIGAQMDTVDLVLANAGTAADMAYSANNAAGVAADVAKPVVNSKTIDPGADATVIMSGSPKTAAAAAKWAASLVVPANMGVEGVATTVLTWSVEFPAA